MGHILRDLLVLGFSTNEMLERKYGVRQVDDSGLLFLVLEFSTNEVLERKYGVGQVDDSGLSPFAA